MYHQLVPVEKFVPTCVWRCSLFGFSPYRLSSGRIEGSTYTTFQGSGPLTLRYVAGFMVPAPTCWDSIIVAELAPLTHEIACCYSLP